MIKTAAISVCICTALAAVPIMATAQHATDARICENPKLTNVAEITNRLASFSWTRSNAPQDGIDTLIAAIFLGNSDGTKPETWGPFLASTTELVQAPRPNDAVYTLSNATFTVGLTSADNRVCMLTSDQSYMAELIAAYPSARVVQNGPRTFFYLDTPDISILASDFPANARPDVALPKDVSFTVTYRLNGNAAQKADK